MRINTPGPPETRGRGAILAPPILWTTVKDIQAMSRIHRARIRSREDGLTRMRTTMAVLWTTSMIKNRVPIVAKAKYPLTIRSYPPTFGERALLSLSSGIDPFHETTAGH
jgi:hypothetical protein